ncbi:antitoxin VapB family protein [Candidatus Woesearchaeota archaeon]|nr:antitoxin VapB family protein [Candidatus Woesearchaeota archaeon]
MAVKTITITKEAYDALASDKKTDESFSELVLRTHRKKNDIWKFVGAWSDMSDEDADKLHAHVEKIRANAGKARRKELMQHLK